MTVRSAGDHTVPGGSYHFLYRGRAEGLLWWRQKPAAEYIASQTRLGRDIRRSADAHVEGVQRVELTSPLEDNGAG